MSHYPQSPCPSVPSPRVPLSPVPPSPNAARPQVPAAPLPAFPSADAEDDATAEDTQAMVRAQNKKKKSGGFQSMGACA